MVPAPQGTKHCQWYMPGVPVRTDKVITFVHPARALRLTGTWKPSPPGQRGAICACGCFSGGTLGAFGTVRVMVFFVIELKSRAVHLAGIRVDPDSAWVVQTARNLLDPVDGFLRNATDITALVAVP